MPQTSALLTLPNVLSLSRLALVPVFVALPAAEARAAVVALAAVTDVLDGWLARRRRTASRLGAILDPVADHAFVLAALVVLVAGGTLAAWQGLVLVLRDVMSAVGWAVARLTPSLRDVPLLARPAGKAVTVLQVLALLAALVAPAALPTLVVLVGVVAVAAIADYTLVLWRGRRR